VRHTGQTDHSLKAPKAPNRPTDHQTDSNSKQQHHGTVANTQDVHPSKIPPRVAPVRPVKSTGQTGVAWVARDEQHPRVNSPKSKPRSPGSLHELEKTLGILGTPHEESIAKFNPTKTRPKRRNQGNPAKSTSNPRTQEPPKSSTFTHGFGRGITAQRTTKGSHKFPPSNPQEKGPKNTPKKSPREGSENNHQEQPGKTHPNLEKPRRIINT
jgi:hypothetical protein